MRSARDAGLVLGVLGASGRSCDGSPGRELAEALETGFRELPALRRAVHEARLAAQEAELGAARARARAARAPEVLRTGGAGRGAPECAQRLVDLRGELWQEEASREALRAPSVNVEVSRPSLGPESLDGRGRGEGARHAVLRDLDAELMELWQLGESAAARAASAQRVVGREEEELASMQVAVHELTSEAKELRSGACLEELAQGPQQALRNGGWRCDAGHLQARRELDAEAQASCAARFRVRHGPHPSAVRRALEAWDAVLDPEASGQRFARGPGRPHDFPGVLEEREAVIARSRGPW